jgi:hypothetical protein
MLQKLKIDGIFIKLTNPPIEQHCWIAVKTTINGLRPEWENPTKKIKKKKKKSCSMIEWHQLSAAIEIRRRENWIILLSDRGAFVFGP